MAIPNIQTKRVERGGVFGAGCGVQEMHREVICARIWDSFNCSSSQDCARCPKARRLLSALDDDDDDAAAPSMMGFRDAELLRYGTRSLDPAEIFSSGILCRSRLRLAI